MKRGAARDGVDSSGALEVNPFANRGGDAARRDGVRVAPRIVQPGPGGSSLPDPVLPLSVTDRLANG